MIKNSTAFEELGIKKCVSERYPREQFQLAEKLPGYQCKSYEDAQRFFDEELERCGVGYFDVFMLHWLNGKNYEIAEKTRSVPFPAGDKGRRKSETYRFLLP